MDRLPLSVDNGFDAELHLTVNSLITSPQARDKKEGSEMRHLYTLYFCFIQTVLIGPSNRIMLQTEYRPEDFQEFLGGGGGKFSSSENFLNFFLPPSAALSGGNEKISVDFESLLS